MTSKFIKTAFFDLGGTLVGDQRTWIPGAKDTLAKLRARHIRLGIISNTANLERSQILALLPEDFDLVQFETNLIIFSSEVHLEKPSPKIFQLAVKKAGMKSDECLFCTEEHDHILAATHIGMQTFEVQKPPKSDIGQLIGKLVKAGLLPAGS